MDKDGNHYFMEVNPRVQVEHTITEEITGIDIVQSQIMIASGKTLPELGLTQDSIQEPSSYAMQCRVVCREDIICLCMMTLIKSDIRYCL